MLTIVFLCRLPTEGSSPQLLSAGTLAARMNKEQQKSLREGEKREGGEEGEEERERERE